MIDFKEQIISFGKVFNFLNECNKDRRYHFLPLDFCAGLISAIGPGISRLSSINLLRLEILNLTNINIPYSTMLDRLRSNKTVHQLREIFISTLNLLNEKKSNSFSCFKSIATACNVLDIRLADSTSISLPPKASNEFPGTGLGKNGKNPAAVKINIFLSLVSGLIQTASVKAGTTADINFFEKYNFVRGVLYIFDLGYYDYSIFEQIKMVKAFFLVRLKSCSIATLVEILNSDCLILENKNFRGDVSNAQSINLNEIKEYCGNIIDCIINLGSLNLNNRYRCIGFWNEETKKYHFYITNLLVSAVIISALYKLRWQIELTFKALKNSCRWEKFTSANKNVIESLTLASLIAYTLSIGMGNLVAAENPETKNAQTIQRTVRSFGLLATFFCFFIIQPNQTNLDNLTKRAKILSKEFHDPNYKKRPTSAMKAKMFTELKGFNRKNISEKIII